MQLLIEDVFKKYDTLDVLKGATFTFESGKIYGLLGRNGAGKTTLFNIINKDISSDAGRIILKDDDKVVEGNIGYVVSTPNVPSFLTAREFLKFFIEINSEKIKSKKTIDEYFDMVSIDIIDRDKLLKDYSHGMKNKIQLLVNFILEPEVLLLDEPLTSLDVISSEEMKNILRNIKKNSVLIFSSHIMDLIISLCDEIVLLKDGKLEHIKKDDRSDNELKEFIIEKLKNEVDYEK